MDITPYAPILYDLIERACETRNIFPGRGLLRGYETIRKVLRYLATTVNEVFYYDKAKDFNRDLDAYRAWDQHRIPDQRGIMISFAPGVEEKAMYLDREFKQERNGCRKKYMLHYMQNPLQHRAWMFDQRMKHENINRIYPLKNMLDENKCVALVTAPGLGKTQAIVEYIKSLPDSTPVVVVSFRIALSEKQNADFDGMGFTHYSRRAQQVMLRLKELKRLIIQVDSLLRMVVGVKDFVLVLDEWESLNDHLCSSPYINDRREIVKLLVDLIAKSKSVIIADANYSYGSHDFFQSICDINPFIYFNEYIRNPRQASFFAGKGQLVHFILAALRRKENVYVPTNSKRFGKYLFKKILNDPVLKNNPKIAKLYCNETPIGTNGDPIHDMINYHCCIVTPKFQAGNSFVEDHFDRICGYFTAASCSPEASAQLLMRVRNIRDIHNHFYIDSRLGARKRVIHEVSNMYEMAHYISDKGVLFSAEHAYISSKRVLAHIRLNHDTEGISFRDPMNFLALVCASNMNEGHKNYAHRFISVLYGMGYTFHYYYDEVNAAIKALNKETQEEMKLMDQEDREEYLNDLAEVSVPEGKELDQILERHAERKTTRAERLQLTKLRLLSAFALTDPHDPEILEQALQLEHAKDLIRQTLVSACSLDEEVERAYIRRMINNLAGCPEERLPPMRHFYELEHPNRALVILNLLSFVRLLGFDNFFDPREIPLNKESLINYVKCLKDYNGIDYIKLLFERTISDKELNANYILKWLNRKLELLKIKIKFRSNKKQKRIVGYIRSPWRLDVVRDRVNVICPKIEDSSNCNSYLEEYPNLIDRLTQESEEDIHELTASLIESLSTKLSKK